MSTSHALKIACHSIMIVLRHDSHIRSVQTRNYKFRLYPNSDQREKLDHALGTCRWLYNKMIEKIHKEGFQSRNDLNYFLTEMKEQEGWLYQYHSKMLQMVSTQIDGAQKALINLHKKGYNTGNLRFARFFEYRTLTYNQSGFDIVTRGKTDLLWLSKIGFCEIRLHRSFQGQIKQAIITKSKSGKWYVYVTCDVDHSIPKINLTKSVGIDIGIKNFAYDSDGHQTPNPLNLQKMLKPLARIQRKISRRQKGSQNRKKAVRFYQIMHERIKNRRKDFTHKLSTQYAQNYDLMFVERLTKLNMVKNHKVARNILDSGWGTFINMLNYKCKMLIEVPSHNTTSGCSRCRNVVPKGLAVRIHRCDVCGLILDRDHNASINILKKGLEIFGLNLNNAKLPQPKVALPQELRKVTPVEITKWSRKQEKTIELIR